MKIYTIDQLDDFKYQLSKPFKRLIKLKEMMKTLHKSDGEYRIRLHADKYTIWTKGESLEMDLGNGKLIKLDPSYYAEHNARHEKKLEDMYAYAESREER